MRTEKVYNSTTFNGEVFLIGKYRRPATKRLTKELGKYGLDIERLRNVIKGKPYDLYLSEKDLRDPWLIRVSTNRTPAKDERGMYFSKTCIKDIFGYLN